MAVTNRQILDKLNEVLVALEEDRQMYRVCPHCFGTGTVEAGSCSDCGGDGAISKGFISKTVQ